MENVIRIDLGGVNCYLVRNNDKFMLIDTGGHMFMDKTYDDRRDLLKEKLQQNGITKENLKLLVLTHGDNDHVANAAYIQKEYQVPIAMSKEDAFMVQNPEWDCYKINSKYSSWIYTLVFKLINKKIEGLMQKVYGDFQSFEPDTWLSEGMNLEQYGFDGEIYHTPGHTAGSISILDHQGNLFCGDMFANNSKPSLAMNAQDFKLLKEQAQRILEQKVCRIYPGHGDPYDHVS